MLPFTADLIKDIKFYVVRQSSAFGLDLSTIKTVFVMNLPEKLSFFCSVVEWLIGRVVECR
eukprot:Awhi_evm2s8112